MSRNLFNFPRRTVQSSMDDCQRKVEDAFGSLQSEFIFIRSILLWKQPVYSFSAFCVLSFFGSYCTPMFFHYNMCCIQLCVFLLCLSLVVLLKVKLGAAVRRGQTSKMEKERFEKGTLSYQRFCSIIAPVLKYAEPHCGELQKWLHICSDYFLQTHFLISAPMAAFLVHLSFTGIIHFLVVSSWIVFLCSLWMPLQYYGIRRIVYDILEQFFDHPLDAIPVLYICSHYLMGGCRRANYCTNHHLKKPYQWIYFYRRKWWIVDDYDNNELETCFSDPNIKNEYIDLDLDVVCGTHTPCIVDFDTMTIQTSEEISLPMKRLSTKSQTELPGCSVATKWCWYWNNEDGNFEEYTFQQDNASQELERQYLKGEAVFEFQVAVHRYQLYFKKSPMYQKNLRYKTEREVRRRPSFRGTLHASASSIMWKIMEMKKKKKEGAKNKERYIRVEVKKYDLEYRCIKSLFMRTFRSSKGHTTLTIESIERVENQSLWEKYSSTYVDSSGPDENGRFLFHGTRKQSVEGICKTNFDWRMSGESVGAIYGEATYFATNASKSHCYTSPDCDGYRYMFVALVLVGSYTQGKQGLRIPPLKDPMNTYGDRFNSCVDDVRNPKIFAIFDKNQCYPAYLVKYSANRL